MVCKEDLEKMFFEEHMTVEKICEVTHHHPSYVKMKLDLEGGTFVKWRTEDWSGYVHIRDSNGKWVLEHRLVWEQHYGPLSLGWVVHHINGNKHDNRIENLLAMPADLHTSLTMYEYRK